MASSKVYLRSFVALCRSDFDEFRSVFVPKFNDI
jgi:hypothetical protein